MIISTKEENLRMLTDGEAHHSFNIDILGDFVITIFNIYIFLGR